MKLRTLAILVFVLAMLIWVAGAISAPTTLIVDSETNVCADSVNFTGTTVQRSGQDVVVTNDARLSDARTPTAHNQAASTITSGTLDGDRLPAMSATKAGAVPATGTPSGKYLTDGGTWSTPAGAGDVSGPATNSANYVPQWDGANSRTLKDGLAVGTTANCLVQLDASAKLPAVDGSQLTGITAGASTARWLDAYTLLMLHFDGTTTTVTDSSAAAHAVTCSGDATQSATQSVLGGKSLACDGTGDYATVATASTLAWTQYQSATVTWWVRFADAARQQFIFAESGGTSNDFYYTGSALILRCTEALNWTWAATQDRWYQMTLVKGPSGYDDVRLFIDGISQTRASGTLAHGFSLAGGSLIIGNRNGADYGLNGYLDEFVWTVSPWTDAAISDVTGDLLTHGALTTTAHGGLIPAPASPEQGDILYYTGSVWERLAHGTDGQYLKTQGHGANPTWATASGGSAKMAIALMPGASETTGAASDPVLVGVAGTNSNWSELQFSDTTVQNGRWVVSGGLTKGYAGGAVTVRMRWYAAATTGNVVWQVKLLGRINGEVMDVAYDATNAHTVTSAAAGTTLQLVTSDIGWTPIAAELTAADTLLVQITRVASDGSDTMSGDAKLVSASLTED